MPDVAILNFDKNGALEDELPEIAREVTDVVAFVHGWRESPDAALSHYQGIATPLEEILSQSSSKWKGRRAAYIGVIWPSVKYADDLTVLNMRADVFGPPADLLSASAVAAVPLDAETLQARAREVGQFLGIDPDLLAAQALRAASEESARDVLLETLRSATATCRDAFADEQTKVEHASAFDLGGQAFYSAIVRELQYLSSEAFDVVTDNPLVAWLKHLRKDGNAIVAFVLNYLTYNELKIRADIEGTGFAAQVIDPILGAGKCVHLIGHSFGAHLMTAATASVKGKISNLILVEGAFSHNALSIDALEHINGAFKSVIDDQKVSGRIVAVHSDHDAPVWVAYPLASRAYRDTVSLAPSQAIAHIIFGGPTDRYGAMGANGPQNIEGVDRRMFSGTSVPRLYPGLHSLDCTTFVTGHNDVWKREIAYIIAAGLLSPE